MRNLLFFLVFLVKCDEHKFQIKNVPTFLKNKINFVNVVIPKKCFQLENALPVNFSKKGDVDYTDIIQKVLDRNEVVVFPNFSLQVNNKGVYLKSNSKIYFQVNSELRLRSKYDTSNSLVDIKDRFDILRIYNKNNVELYNTNIVGDRYLHKDVLGEWGAGIALRNSSNIKIINAKISKTWGDGIFVGSEDGGVCEKISIENVIIDQARRNGISITSAIKLKLNNVLVSNTHGVAPESAVDVEPSWFKDDINDILIDKIYTYNNIAGLNLNANAFCSNTLDWHKKYNVTIKRHLDLYSKYPFGISLNPKLYVFEPIGKIEVEDVRWINNFSYDYLLADNDPREVKVYFKSVKVKKGNKDITNEVLNKIKKQIVLNN